MSLYVSHWHSRFHGHAPLAPDTVAAWHAALADMDEHALLDGLVRPDEWLLIRRLPVRARWRVGAGGGAGDWLVSLRRALETKLAAGDGDVVRYAGRRHAWSDLFYRLACGERTRVWAWMRMGLLPADVLPGDALGVAAERLAREPQLIWPVLRRLLDAEPGHAAFSAVLRALPASAWHQLLGAEARTQAYQRAADAGDGDGARAAAAVMRPGGATVRTWPVDQAVDPGGVGALLRWLERQPWLGARHGATVATLLAAMTWPAGGDGCLLRARLALARECCAAGADGTGAMPILERSPAGVGTADTHAYHDRVARRVDVRGGDRSAVRTACRSALLPKPIGLPAEPQPVVADLPESVAWRASTHAGALFWLNRLAREDFPGTLSSAGAEDAGDFLAALADALELPADDAARAVFVPPGRVRPPAADWVADAAARVAAWEDWLATAAPDLPPPRVAAICRRVGHLRLEPGWIELRLALDGVDTRVRRLGLDLDPGWLPWLGCVVRIRYV